MIDLIQILRYLAVGGMVTLADLAVYNALTGARARIPRIPANIVSVTLGMALGFMLHFALVFQPHDFLLAKRMFLYAVTVGVSVYGVQNLVIYTLAEVWRGPVHLAQNAARALDVSARCSDDFIDRMTGKMAAAVAGMAWNFVFFKSLVYA